jgi:hypothetical protein
MPDFTKLAAYLDSFDKTHEQYDVVCFIKNKIAEDLRDTSTVNNGDSEDLMDTDVTTSTPEQQTHDNTEGKIMGGAFKELDALNQIKEEKEEVKIHGKKDKTTEERHIDSATEEHFGDEVLNRKNASLFDTLQKKIKR